MDPWITVDELSVWVQEDIPPTDAYAQLVVKASTILVSHATGYHGTDREFTTATAPDRLKIVVAQVAKRNWLNPTQITREGNVGPLGGDTYAEAMAAGMSLTDEESAVVAKVAREFYEGAGTGGRLSVVRFGVAHNARADDTVPHVPDVGAEGTDFAAGSDWMFPMGW